MKVVCINNGEMDKATNDWVNLTIGKTYVDLILKSIERDKKIISILDDGKTNT
jgi:hypothetical protein